ncbi:MAG: metallophosphoesterase family protein [Deltaproteobacteria bacterium]|nr:metallophosphoesterase family protein [Deltaproteobacteria bacterium]
MDPWDPAGRLVDDDVRASPPRPVGRALLCVSDVHGDRAALEAVLDATRHLRLEGIVAAGDHCLGGPDPFGVWQRLLQLGATLVRGASDLALGTVGASEVSPTSAREEVRLLTFLRTQEALGQIVCRKLAELPVTAVVSLEDTSGVMVMHGSPNDDLRGLLDDEHLADEVACVAEDVLVVGATHRGFERRLGNLLIINAGSVGRSPTRRADLRTAHAVLVQPFSDGVVRAFARDVPVPAAAARRAV